MKDSGVLFHAKHAYMPNLLGYCGPDENERLHEGLKEGKTDDRLIHTLQEFEAAYPFLELIARSTGREVFDYSVPEAYWIGNGLLDRVPGSEFYSFSHHELKGRDPRKVKEAFKGLDGVAPPHHSFYVMSTYATTVTPDGPNLSNESRNKVAQLVDNCRISWGEVRGVGRRELQVKVRPIEFQEGRLALAPLTVRRVQYNPEVKPFSSVRIGDVVSIHWNFACEVLTNRQSKNLAKYTAIDLGLVNRLLAGGTRRPKK